MTDYLLGVDAGQTVTKAVLFDPDGRALASGSARVELHSPRPHWVERDMDEVWRASAAAMRTCVAASGIAPARIEAVGLVGHNDGLYAVDAELRPVRPAITAMDSRAGEVVAAWRGTPLWQEVLAASGQVPFAASPAAVLSWLYANEPEAARRASAFLFCKDWIKACLTGEVSTDPTEASASFTDVATQDYSLDLLRLFGLSEVAAKLPLIVPSGQIAGRVVAPAAELTGLVAGTPVVSGAHDVDAAALGMGVVDPGMLTLIAGTFSINQVISADVRTDERWQARNHLVAGQWMNMSTSPASTSNLDWLLRELGGGLPIEQVSAEVAGVLDGPSQMLFHPFLFGSPHGEHASASLIGLRGWHRRAHVLRAVLEGVVLNHRTHTAALRERFPMPATARLSGGGARSAVLAQMFADALDVTIELTDSDETGARGAALLAGFGAGVYPDLDQASRTVRVVRTHKPGPERRAILDDAYESYVEAARLLEPIWRRQ